MTEFETKALGYLERIAKAVEGKAATGGQRSNSGASGLMFPNYGRSKGQPIAGAAIDELTYYANGAVRSLEDPSKERFHAKEQALLDAINDELAKQGQAPIGAAGGAADDFGPPPGGYAGGAHEDDIPFAPRWDVA